MNDYFTNPCVIIIAYIITFIAFVYFHEAGHYFAFKMINVKVEKVNFDRFKIMPDSVTASGQITGKNPRIKMCFVLINGLVCSLVPVFVFYFVFKDVWLSICLLYFAVNGARNDCRVIWNIWLTRSFRDVSCNDYGVVGHDY